MADIATAQTVTPEAVVRASFDAISRHDLDALAALWAPDGEDHIAGQADLNGPDGVRAYFGELIAAVPDLRVTLRRTVTEGDHVAAHWSLEGTFAGPGAYQGMAPTGARIELEGLDLFRVRDGLLVRNDAYTDGMTFARQLGLLPPKGSTAEQRMTQAFNLRTKAARRASAGEAERVADGVWILRGGFPLKLMNAYLLEDEGGGVTLFDAGIRSMTKALAGTSAAMGGINRIVLSHAHRDHRGAAAGLAAPVWVHPAEREDAEGDGGWHYADQERLGIPARWILPRWLERWDGGPVAVAGTIEEGDDVSGFRVVHLPGHAPGQVALFRDSDRLALTGDAFYTLDIETGLRGAPRVPHRAFNQAEEQARASLRKLAALEPSAAWPGHGDPVTGDVRAQLERAAAAT